MPRQAAKNPSEDQWEFHREELERLYDKENKPLKKVMSHMQRQYNFVATSYQYETHLTKKWKIRKNINSKEWQDIIIAARLRKRVKNPVEVSINGKKKSARAVQREVKKYSHLAEYHQSSALSRPIPRGVSIRKPLVCTRNPVAAQLPFHDFENLIILMKMSIAPTTSRYSALLRSIRTTPYLSDPFQRRKLLTNSITTSPFNSFVFPQGSSLLPDISDMGCYINEALQAIAPDSDSSHRPFHDPLMNARSRLFTVPFLRNLLFSVANNFAGLEALPLYKVIGRLQLETCGRLYQLLCPEAACYTTQAIALNLFKAAIEVGDARSVDSLLSQSVPGIHSNLFFCADGDKVLTPLEHASAQVDVDVVKVLLKHGADPNQQFFGRNKQPLYGGALYAAVNPPLRYTTSQEERKRFELFQILLNSDADVPIIEGPNSVTFLRKLIKTRQRLSIPLILSKYAPGNLNQWHKQGIFHSIFIYCDVNTARACLEILIRNCINLNADVGQFKGDQFPGRVRIIDKVAYYGDVHTIKYLLAIGVQLTDDTLPCAILSKKRDLTEYLLHYGAAIHRIGLLGISPLAAAIRVRDDSIYQKIVNHQGLSNLHEPTFFRSTLEAALSVGDVGLIKNLIQIDDKIRPEDLGIALVATTKEGRDKDTLALLDLGAHPNPSTTDLMRLRIDGSPLANALRWGDTTIVLSLIHSNAALNCTDDDDRFDTLSMLALAVQIGSCTLVQTMIKAGCNVNYLGSGEESVPPLVMAVNLRDEEMLDILLSAGCDINYPHAEYTALSAATEFGDVDITTYLLDHGADPHDSLALAHSLTFLDENIEVLDLLLERHATRYPKGRKRWGGEALRMAIEMKDIELFTKLLRGGADANDDGQTFESASPFAYSVINSASIGLKFVESLLDDKRMDCTPETIFTYYSRDNDHEPVAQSTAFLEAIGSSHIPTVELFLTYGADINYPATLGVKRTPLQRAAEVGNMKIVELLLKRGAEVNAPAAQRGGGTALQLAAMKGFLAIVRLLVTKWGADLQIPPSKVDGRTPLEGAAEHGRLDTLGFLLAAGAGNEGKDKKQFERAISFAEDNLQFPAANMLKGYLHQKEHGIEPFLEEDLIDWSRCE